LGWWFGGFQTTQTTSHPLVDSRQLAKILKAFGFGDPFERDRPWSVIEGESLENFPKIVFSFSKDITVHLGNCRYRSYRIQLGPCPLRFILAHALLLPISPATQLFC